MDARLWVAALAGACALAGGARAELPPLPEPGEPGSHERYVEALRREEARVAAELLGRYERRIAEAPGDRVAAIERCRFLGAAFYDAETESNPREEEHAACVEELESRFATDAEARVFAIEQRWGDEAAEAGSRFLADPPSTAEPRHLAAVHAHLARQLEYGESGGALDHAERAMALDPSLDLRLLAARERSSAGDRAGARALLAENLAATRDGWELEAKGALLADLGDFDAALAAFDEVARRGEPPRRKLDHAHALAGAGRIEEARALYAAGPGAWASLEALRAHLAFELEHGSAESARAAYDALRARGFEADPFGRERFALLVAHPRAAWKWKDGVGFASLAALALALALLPAGFVVPVHAVGLLRGGRRAAAPGSPAPFGLRDAWLATTAFILAQGLALFVHPSAFDEGAAQAATRPELASFAVLGAVASLGGVLLVARGRTRRLLGAGRWGARRTLATGVLLAVGLRLVVFAIARAGGSSPTPEPTIEMLESVQQTFGLSANLLWAALLTPIAEEILFRGILREAFATRLGDRLANVAQAALFGLAHAHPILSPAFFLLGLAAGRVTQASGSLRTALVAHVLINAFACIALAYLGA